MMFSVGAELFNTRRETYGIVAKVHVGLGKLTADYLPQNAYSVLVNGKYQVWLEKSDYLISKDELQ